MTASKKSIPDIAIEIAPNEQYLVILRQLMKCLAEYFGLDCADTAKLEMCVDEACANSINAIQQHALEGRDQKVRIELDIQESCICVIVQDPGDNFSHHFDKASPFGESCDRTRRRGYGLKIIKTFMDEVHYFHDPKSGNQLRLKKFLTKEEIKEE